MDLVERYLAAVRRHLPGSRADDIVAELRDDLLSRIEAREEALGRPLSAREVEALLKDAGHPLVVAARYRRHQWLIGPDVFPFYVHTLWVVLLVVAFAIAVGAAAHFVFDSGHAMRGALQTLASLWNSLISAVGVITIVFAVLERTGAIEKHRAKWSPADLPEIKDERPGRWESAFELAANLAVIAWWAGWLPIPSVTGSNAVRIVAAPVWATLFWPILALLVVRLVHNGVQAFRPRWRGLRIVLGLATAIGGIAILLVAYQAGHWVTPVSSTLPADQLAGIDRAVNEALRWGLLWVGAIWVWQCAKEIWRVTAKRPLMPFAV